MKIRIAVIIFFMLLAPRAFAATGCNYPSSVDSFTNKIAGDFLTVADINKTNCGVEQAQTRINQIFAGKAGSQTVTGGTAASETLTLLSTAHGTKGKILLDGFAAFDGATSRLGIGTTSPTVAIDFIGSAQQFVRSDSGAPVYQGLRARDNAGANEALQDLDFLFFIQADGYTGSAFTSGKASLQFGAKGAWTGSNTGTFFGLNLTPQGSTTPQSVAVWDTNGLRIGNSFAESALHLSNTSAAHAAITFDESSNTPNDPANGTQARMYMRGDKLVVQFLHGAQIRYYYLDLTAGSNQSWIHTTSAP